MLTVERNALDFELPEKLEAHEPPEARGLARDQVRLLVSHISDNRVEHRRFTDLPDVLRPGDLVVANDSATLAAALPTPSMLTTVWSRAFSMKLLD